MTEDGKLADARAGEGDLRFEAEANSSIVTHWIKSRVKPLQQASMSVRLRFRVMIDRCVRNWFPRECQK